MYACCVCIPVSYIWCTDIQYLVEGCVCVCVCVCLFVCVCTILSVGTDMCMCDLLCACVYRSVGVGIYNSE